MTADELDAIKARLTSATPGSWFAWPNDLIGGWCVRVVDTPPSEGPGDVADFIEEADARLIAAAPSDIAALLAEVERLRDEVRADRAAVVAWLREVSERRFPRNEREQGIVFRLAHEIERGEYRREESG